MTLVFERLKTKLMKTNILFRFITKTKLMVLVLDWFKTKQIKLVFGWLKTKLMKTNVLFGFITKTKLMDLVLDWLKIKQI